MKLLGKLAFITAAWSGSVFAQSRTPTSWWENFDRTATAAASWVNNLSRTSAEAFRKNSATFQIDLGAVRHQQLAPSWLLQVGAEASAFTAPRYELTNYFTAGPRLGLQYKLGLGPLAPVVQLDTALDYKFARLDADRGWGVETNLRLAKRLAPGVRAAIGGQWLEHYARSATFDLHQHSLYVEATWDFGERWSLSGRAGRLNGDVVANAAWPVWAQALDGAFGEEVEEYYTARPWEITHLYGDKWVSYNVEAKADLLALTLSYAANDRTTLELRYNSAFVINSADIRYPTDSWGLGVVHRF